MKRMVTNGAYNDPDSRRAIVEMTNEEVGMMERIIEYSLHAYSKILALDKATLQDMLNASKETNKITKELAPESIDFQEASESLKQSDELLNQIKEQYTIFISHLSSIDGKFEISENNHCILNITPDEYASLIHSLQEQTLLMFTLSNADKSNFEEIVKNINNSKNLDFNDENQFDVASRQMFFTKEEYDSYADLGSSDERITVMQDLTTHYMHICNKLIETLNQPYEGAVYMD